MVRAVSENLESIKKLRKIFNIFSASEAVVRPHLILTGPSGSGKSYNVRQIAEEFKLGFLEINAAQLTKEGTSGNSLSKALSPLINAPEELIICFVDEFDKLFISGNSNSHLAHETTNGVQNEFLKVLESNSTSVYGDYGKYMDVSVEKVLFVFAGAFNGEEDITIDRLREFGIKTEFLGRVGLVYNLGKLTLEELRNILENSTLLESYLALFPEVKRDYVINEVMKVIEKTYDKNTLGARLITTLLHKFFIDGGKLLPDEVKKVSFQKSLKLL